MFWERQLISDDGQIFSYESQPGATNGQDPWSTSKGNSGLWTGGCWLGRRLHSSSRPPPPWTPVQQFSYFCMTSSLRKRVLLIELIGAWLTSALLLLLNSYLIALSWSGLCSVWEREICFTDLPLVGVFLSRVPHNLSVYGLSIAMKLPLLLLSFYDDDLVKRAAHQTVSSAQHTDRRICSSHPKDFIVTRAWGFSCFRLVMPSEDFVVISDPFWFE